MTRPVTTSTLFPYTTLFRSRSHLGTAGATWIRQSPRGVPAVPRGDRSEEHTSELQSRGQLVCRLLLDKKITLLIVLLAPHAGPLTARVGASWLVSTRIGLSW